MVNRVLPVAGLTKVLVFWLKFYLFAIALTTISDIWTHYSFRLMADNRMPPGVIALIMGEIGVVRAEKPGDEPHSAVDLEEPAAEALAKELGISLWDEIDLSLTGTLYLAFLGSYLLTTLLFLVWVHRMSANLGTLHGEQFAYTPLWSVACYFVPLVNLVMPPRIMQKIWVTVSGSEDKSLVPGWWTLIVLQWIAGQIDHRVLMAARQRGQLVHHLFSTTSLLFDLVWHVLSALVAFYTLLMVRQITREYCRRLQDGSVKLTSQVSTPP
jgi:hypothetical protein